MADPRVERIAENEDAFRHLNEELGVMGVFMCECSDPSCREHIQMARERFQEIRADPFLFFVKPGHERPDVEEVVERADGYHVVRKPDEVGHIVADE